MSDLSAAEVVDVLVPVIERAIARRMEEVYGAIEQLREEFQQSIGVLDGNDRAVIAVVQEMRGQVTGEGYQVAEVLTKAAQSWERFVRGEAEILGLKVIVPKVSVEKIEVREMTDDEAAAEERTWD